MAIASREAVTPPGFEGFPWADMLNMWSNDFYSRSVELRIWHAHNNSPELTARGYWLEASKRHIEMWAWLEARFEMFVIPRFDFEGSAFLDIESGDRDWDRLAAFSTFYLGDKISKPVVG